MRRRGLGLEKARGATPRLGSARHGEARASPAPQGQSSLLAPGRALADRLRLAPSLCPSVPPSDSLALAAARAAGAGGGGSAARGPSAPPGSPREVQPGSEEARLARAAGSGARSPSTAASPAEPSSPSGCGGTKPAARSRASASGAPRAEHRGAGVTLAGQAAAGGPATASPDAAQS